MVREGATNFFEGSQMRKRLIAAATATGVAALSIAAGTSLAAHTNASAGKATAIPSMTVLFDRAVTKIRNTRRPTFARAIVLEADGITAGGKCTQEGCSGGRGTTSASGFVSWRFVFNNQGSRSRFKSATLTYGPPPKGFGPVRGVTAPFVEDVQIPHAPRLTVAQAVTLLQRAGHRAKFFNVALRNPVGPKRSNPLYIFGFAGSNYVAVDTVTKKVRPF
jgi:hypothetical protein